MLLVNYLDGTGANTLANLVKDCRAKKTKLILSAVQSQPAEILGRAGVHPDEQSLYFAANYDEALMLAEKITSKNK
jgi:anti-anti-sigma regulatory factor